MTHTRRAAAMLGCGVIAMAAGSAPGQEFRVDTSKEVFWPPDFCWEEVQTTPFEGASGYCERTGGAYGRVGCTGSSGRVPRFRLSVTHRTGSSSTFFRGAAGSRFSVPVTFTATSGQSHATVGLSLAMFNAWSYTYDCENCGGEIDPAIPTVTLMSARSGLSGSGPSFEANVGDSGPAPEGWSYDGNSMLVNIEGLTQWSVEVSAELNLDMNGQDQDSWAGADALVLLGPANPDGSIGPIFEFPDCPTCTANAPDIYLIDNYIYPPPGTCIGDLDNDNDNDVFDFGEFAANFGRDDLIPGTGGDMDYDGDCDVFDFGAWSADFGCGG